MVELLLKALERGKCVCGLVTVVKWDLHFETVFNIREKLAGLEGVGHK